MFYIFFLAVYGFFPGSEKKMVLSSAKKLGGCHERRLGNVTTHMVPQRMPMSARKRSPFGKSPVHRAGNNVASIMERRPLAPKNSNSTQIPSTRVLPPKFSGSLTERKQDIPKQPVTRQVKQNFLTPLKLTFCSTGSHRAEGKEGRRERNPEASDG